MKFTTLALLLACSVLVSAAPVPQDASDAPVAPKSVLQDDYAAPVPQDDSAYHVPQEASVIDASSVDIKTVGSVSDQPIAITNGLYGHYHPTSHIGGGGGGEKTWGNTPERVVNVNK
jgi:hypothetical protein